MCHTFLDSDFLSEAGCLFETEASFSISLRSIKDDSGIVWKEWLHMESLTNSES